MKLRYTLVVALIAIGSAMGSAHAAAGFTEDYSAATGDLDGDGLIDIYVRAKPDIVMIPFDDLVVPIPRPLPVPPFVLRRHADQTFELLANLTPAQRAGASQWPVSTAIHVDAVDANVDGIRDVVLTGISGANPVMVYSSTTDKAAAQSTKTGNAQFTTFLTDMFNWIVDPAIPGIVTEYDYYALIDLIINQIPINGLAITDDPYDPETLPDVCFVTDCYYDYYYGWVAFLKLQYPVTIYQHQITSQDAWDLIQIFGPIMDDVTVVAQSARARAIADILERVFGTQILGGTLRNGGRQDPESDLPPADVSETRGIGILTMLTEVATAATNAGDWRLLTAGEKSTLARGNGMQIKNVDRVRVYHKGFLGLNTQVITPGGNIFIGRNSPLMPWSEDYSVVPDLLPRSTLVHELLHVYQSRNRGCGYVCKGFRKLFSDYCYVIVPGKDYWKYNMEEEAEMMSDRYRLRQPFGVVYQSCNSAATLAALEQTIPLH